MGNKVLLSFWDTSEKSPKLSGNSAFGAVFENLSAQKVIRPTPSPQKLTRPAPSHKKRKRGMGQKTLVRLGKVRLVS